MRPPKWPQQRLLLPLLPALLYTSPSHAAQPSSPSPIPGPLRALPWAQLNILHTTDTHGWHAGHLQEAQYSADWGDYASFVHHLRARADEAGDADVLVVDTGDRVEGNGLYDASDPKGLYTREVVQGVEFDVLTTGNHELYQADTTAKEYEEVAPRFRRSYVSSNVDVWSRKEGGFVPLAPRFRKFKTRNLGITVMAFGFLFDFHGGSNESHVQNVEETIKEQWFQDAIREQGVDLYLVAGHVPIRDSEESDALYKAIREAQWDTPIVMLGGHTHIRDYRVWDKRAQGIESGRYMETIGFMSIDGLGTSGKGVRAEARSNPTFERMYIDNNLYSLEHHTGLMGDNFTTSHGRNITEKIAKARKHLNLDHAFGCAPQDYWLNRAPYPANDSLVSLVEERVLPETFEALDRPSIILTNTGALRFDIFKGPFTIDSTYLVSPFTSNFRAIRDVPYKAASQVLALLNNEGKITTAELMATLANVDEDAAAHFKGIAHDMLAPPFPPMSLFAWSAQKWRRAEQHSRASPFDQLPLFSNRKRLIPGYTTHDDVGRDGDDTEHEEIQFYDVPNCVGATVHFDGSATASSHPERVDLVFNAFIQPWVLLALRFLGVSYGPDNTKVVLDGKTLTNILSEWVGEAWEC